MSTKEILTGIYNNLSQSYDIVQEETKEATCAKELEYLAGQSKGLNLSMGLIAHGINDLNIKNKQDERKN